MVSRRDVLIGSVAAGAVAMAHRAGVAFGAVTDSKVTFSVPAGAVDTHTHVVPDPKAFPYWSGRVYTPETATAADSLAMHKRIGVDRIVIVHPSFYGTDNTPTLDGLKQLGPSSRAIVVIDDKTSESQLDDMHRAGARGIRLNFSTFGQTDPNVTRARFKAAVDRLTPRTPWHIQLFTTPPVIEALEADIMNAPMPIVIDHFGYAPAKNGVNQPGFVALLRLVRAGKAYVKVSAAYRVSSLPNDYSDVAPLAQALIAANPRRILWGTDWPHPAGAALPGTKATDIAPNLPIDNGLLLNLLVSWAPDASQRKTILVDNPAQLFGY